MRALPLLIALLLLPLAACGPSTRTVAKTPPLDAGRLDEEITLLGERVYPARLGVAVQNLDGGEAWVRNDQDRYPMQSVFKAPLAAAVLAEVDAGRLSLDEVITIGDMDLSPPLSPIGQAWPAVSRYTVGDLLRRAVSDSDNTAADVLMRRIGGPGAVNAWLTARGVEEIRIDRYERELQPEINGMPSFRPAWRTPEAFGAAMQAVPEAQRRAAQAHYIEDPRDTASAVGTLVFLRKLKTGELVSPASTALLLRLMTQTTTGPGRLKAGLPEGATLAHKTGTSATAFGVTAVTNDIGIVTLKDGRHYAVAVFLIGSPASLKDREAVIAEVMRTVAKATR
jgi:beta-lactamase class A